MSSLHIGIWFYFTDICFQYVSLAEIYTAILFIVILSLLLSL